MLQPTDPMPSRGVLSSHQLGLVVGAWFFQSVLGWGLSSVAISCRNALEDC